MRLDKAQKKLLADFFEKFALAIATATAVRLLFDDGATSELIYLLAAVVIIIMVALAMGIVHGTENKPKDDVMHTEVKKGVFHIENAEVKNK